MPTGDNCAEVIGLQKLIDRYIRSWKRRNGDAAVQFALEALSTDPTVMAAVYRAVAEVLTMKEAEQQAVIASKVESVVEAVPARLHRRFNSHIAQLDRPDKAGKK